MEGKKDVQMEDVNEGKNERKESAGVVRVNPVQDFIRYIVWNPIDRNK